jgi:hypothetical protein
LRGVRHKIVLDFGIPLGARPGDRTDARGVILPNAPIPRAAIPSPFANDVLTFPPHTRKLPGNPKTDERTEQAS